MDLRAVLEAESDPEYREFQRKLIPGCDAIIGVRAPVVRRIVRSIIGGDWRGFLDSAGDLPSVEERYVVGGVIMNAPMPLDERIGRIRAFVPLIDNWAVCDAFVYKPKADEREAYWHILEEYIGCGTEYGMRFAAVGMMQYLDDDYIDSVLRLLGEAEHDGYYLKMGVAWAISYCYVAYPEKTMAFLRDCPLDDATYRMALRKIVESYRVSDDDKAVIRSMRKRSE